MSQAKENEGQKKPFSKDFVDTAAESLHDKYPDAKRWRDFFERHGLLKLVMALLVLGAALYCGYRWGNADKDKEVTPIVEGLAKTNSEYVGSIKILEKQLESMTQDRDKYQTLAAIMATMPTGMVALVTNISAYVSNEPAKWAGVLSMFSDMTNRLAKSDRSAPHFSLFINEEPIADGDVIQAVFLKPDAFVSFRITNRGSIAVKGIALDVMFPTNYEHFVGSPTDGWRLQTSTHTDSNGKTVPRLGFGAWHYESQGLFAENHGVAGAFSISKKAEGVPLLAIATVYSEGSAKKNFQIAFLVTPEPTNAPVDSTSSDPH